MALSWKVLLFLFFVVLCCCVAGQEQECECVAGQEKRRTINNMIAIGIDMTRSPCPLFKVCCLLPPEAKSTNATELEINNSPSELPRQEQKCECVPYFLCRNGTINSNGEALLVVL